MSQMAQSTAVQHANPGERLSDFGEDAVRKHLVQNVDQAVRSVLEQGTGSPTTSVHDQDIEGTTLLTFASREQDDDVLPRILNLPQPSAHRSLSATLHALQEWEGYVVEIGEDEFVARLVDLTAGMSYETDEATIPMEEISEHDAEKMSEGDIFRWVIGYERSASGTKRRVSQIVFRDLPRMTAADFEEGRKWAERVARSLNP